MLTHGALHRLAIDRPPVSRAFEFREPMARHQPAKSRIRRGAGSKTVLIMQSIVKSLGHMCVFYISVIIRLFLNWTLC